MSNIPTSKQQLILHLLEHGKTHTWQELAEKFNIKNRHGFVDGRTANDVWRNYRDKNFKKGYKLPDNRSNKQLQEKAIELRANWNLADGSEGASYRNKPFLPDKTKLLKDIIDSQDGSLELRSVWTQADGEIGFSYRRKHESEEFEEFGQLLKELKWSINEHLQDYPAKKEPPHIEFVYPKIGVVSIADLHIGAKISDLIKTPDFSIDILIDYLSQVADIINKQCFSEVHLSILGDIIESFTGLNHLNVWKNLEYKAWGSNAVIISCEILSKFLSQITNLHFVYIVSGNHDRTTSNSKEDTEGGVAQLVHYFLSQKFTSINFEWDPMLLSKEIDGLCYIFTHGHHNFVKGNVGDICFKYGKQGMYNILLSGHLHVRSKKNNNFSKEDSILEDNSDYRALKCPPLFTGNFYSESNSWTSTAGFMMFQNMNGLPYTHDIPLKI